MDFLIRLYYYLRGWSGFWKDPKTGRWFAYDPSHMNDYYSYEAERLPIPKLCEFFHARELEAEYLKKIAGMNEFFENADYEAGQTILSQGREIARLELENQKLREVK